MRAQNGHDRLMFGVEAEYLLVDAETFRPLWHNDLSFERLNAALEAIDVSDLPGLDGLDLEKPHRKLMPFAVEGYHVPDPDLNPIDLLPKGVEIRTPVCNSMDQCLAALATLHQRLQTALLELGYRAASLSHHPAATHFEGPQNKRRYDYWQWAMEFMVTYGPDINVSLPQSLSGRIDTKDLLAKVNYYGPAMAALSLASPIYQGKLWDIRGKIGKSIRTHRRSVIAPAIELHLAERGRMEFKLFEATNSLLDYRCYFLLWLTILLDKTLEGRASNQTRIYDLGAAARHGLAAETIPDRAEALLDRAEEVLPDFRLDPAPLRVFRERLSRFRLPADDIIDLFRREGSVEAVLRQRTCLELADGKPELALSAD